MRTPKGTIEHAKIYFGNDHIVLDGVDKKAYLKCLRFQNQYTFVITAIQAL